jgi:HlyD family secretion protein
MEQEGFSPVEKGLVEVPMKLHGGQRTARHLGDQPDPLPRPPPAGVPGPNASEPCDDVGPRLGCENGFEGRRTRLPFFLVSLAVTALSSGHLERLFLKGNSVKKWFKSLLILGLCLAGASLLRFTVFKPQPVPVTVYRVGTGRVEDTVVNSRAGTIKSRLRAKMSPGIAGLVTGIPAKKGSRVNRNDVLLQLDDSEHRAQVQLARSTLEAARSAAQQAKLEAEHAQREWKRTQALAQSQIVSENLIDQAQTLALATEAASATAQAKIQESEAALEAAQAILAKTTMKAPFDGVVLDVTTEVGEWISPSPPGVFIPPVVDLIDPAALYVSAPIDEADVARIRLGSPVRITFDAFRGKSFAGTLTYVSSFVETRQEQNRTLEVEAAYTDNPLPASLLAGLSADLEVILDARDAVLRIPTYALMEGSRVMVIQDNHLVKRPVTTGLHNWKYTEITSGLAAGERVVVSLDRPEVTPGARVVITGEAE